MTAPADTAVTGLTELAVRARTDAGQVNTVPPAPGRSLPQILRANVLTRFNAILGALFAVVLVVGPPQDALFGAVLVINTSTGVAQELRAKRALDRLAILTAGRARAVRDGVVTEIALDRIVLITAMGACIVPLLAVPAARRILALQLPPAPVLAACACVVLAAAAALTLWRRWRGPGAAGQVT